MILGFTSGAIANRDSLLQRLHLYQDIGCNAVELNISSNEIDLLEGMDELGEINKMFEYTSVHLPAGDFNYSKANGKLSRLDQIVKTVKPQVLVLHPDVASDFDVRPELAWPLALENMDWRNRIGKTTEDLISLFKLFPNAKMVLDLNHAYSISKDLLLARDLWDKFSDRIIHFHLSGFDGPDRLHALLSEVTSGKTIIASLPTQNLPIILEPGLADFIPDKLKKEFEFVTARIDKLLPPT